MVRVRFFPFALVCILHCMLPDAYAGANSIHITVFAGPRQTFRGFGTSFNNGMFYAPAYQRLAPGTRRELATLLWDDLDMRVMRLYAVDRVNYPEVFETRFGLIITEAREAKERRRARTGDMTDSLILLLAPEGSPADLRAYARDYARFMRELLDNHGIRIDVTGVCNEPNVFERMQPADIPEVVKYFRSELDAVGLHDVRIVAPENSNVDLIAVETVEKIIADPEALAALDAFSTHSYNMGMLDWMRGVVSPYTEPNGDKEYWQTEASAEGREGPNDGEQGASSLARVISDVNLGVTHWVWFLGYERNNSATHLVWYDGATGEYTIFLKYFYLLQFSRTFDVGTVFRTGESDLHERTGRREDQYMEYTWGRKPPIYAVAGVNPDGDWGIAIVNYTGVASEWAGSSTYEGATYDVTVTIEELAGAGSMAFRVCRSSESARFSLDSNSVTMVDGEVTVPVEPLEIVCLRPAFDMQLQASSFPDQELGYEPATGPLGSCGPGIGLSLLPPLILGCARRLRRRRSLRKDRAG